MTVPTFISRARQAVALNAADALFAFTVTGSVPAALLALAGLPLAEFLRPAAALSPRAIQ
jgi:hypothetical protein